MSQLIQMRQRLKAIETIKKITSAMRVISRSLHTRMNHKRSTLTNYSTEIKNIFNTIRMLHQTWQPKEFFPHPSDAPHELLIIVGAQKGLCGTYTSDITYWLKNHRHELTERSLSVIAVGKKTGDLLKPYNPSIILQIDELKNSNIQETAATLLKQCIEPKKPYTSIKIISNRPETFFQHKFTATTVLPFEAPSVPISEKEDFQWFNKPNIVLETVAKTYLESLLYLALFEALLAEQSARFIAMDNATRNAQKVIESMKLHYNKLRQAKITAELTELASNY